MEYQRGMCDACPNRHQADTLAALADAAQKSMLLRFLAPVLRQRSEAITANGCGWWWGVPEENEQTGQTRTRYLCGRAALPDYIRRYGLDISRASEQIVDAEGRAGKAMHRVASALAAMADQPPGSLPLFDGAAESKRSALLVEGKRD